MGRMKGPPASSPEIRRRMERTRRRDTGPEREIRRRLHALGYRYRVDARPTESCRSRADIVFRSRKLAIFVDGCFWHGCATHGTWPKANAAWWKQKIRANMARDEKTSATLRDCGWRVIRIWEHQPADEAVSEIVSNLISAG